MDTLNQRAAEAEALVFRRFVGRHRGIPGTLLGSTVAAPGENTRRIVVDGTQPFHYWWQAHLLDAIVDGGHRRLRTGDGVGARRSAILGHRLLATIRMRNKGTLRNHFFDDMAWLALAVERLAALDQRVGARWLRTSLTPARRGLTRELLGSLDGTGAVVWNRDRDYRNAATAGPVALHLARTGDVARSRRIVDWLFDTLLEEDRGLIRDGILSGADVVEHVYTYNQGTTLGALLELGRPRDLQRAEALVQALGCHLTRADHGHRVLVQHGGGDGGLFTGILARYLSIAGADARLDAGTRSDAALLVRATGDALWQQRDPDTGLFPLAAPHVELSTQLQGWLVLEAAAGLGA
ncbi:glycoside hydrolase family 76 protein [Tessaracoccus sp.]